MPLVEFPNGERVDFPDDMPEDQMHSAAQQYWQSKQKPQMGAMERFGYGAGNVAYGLAQLSRKATEAAVPEHLRSMLELPGKPITEDVLQQRQIDYEARKPEGYDIAKMAGEITATLPLAIAGGAGLAGSAAAGAVAGMAQPVTGDEDKYWQTKMKQAALGAAGGGIAAAGGKVLGKVVAGAENPAAKGLMEEGITPTLGQTIGPAAGRVEEKLTSLPFLGSQITRSRQAAVESLNVAAYNRALTPIGQKASGVVGHEGVDEVRQSLSSAFDELTPKLKIAPNILEADVAPIVAKASEYLPETWQKRLGDVLQNARARLQNAGAEPNFKEAESYLDYFATDFGRSPHPDEAKFGDTVSEILTSARASLAKQNPEYASRLSAINQGWANYDIIRRAASSTASQGGIFTPEALNAAVKAHAVARGGQALGTGQFAVGQALMQNLSSPARVVLGKQVPTSGTAERLFTGVGLAGVGYTAGLFRPDVLAAAGAASLPYMNPLFRRAAAAAILQRPAGAATAGKVAETVGRAASPGVGFVLSVAGAP